MAIMDSTCFLFKVIILSCKGMNKDKVNTLYKLYEIPQSPKKAHFGMTERENDNRITKNCNLK